MGAALLRANPHISVDVHNPEITVRVEIREKAAYIHGETKPGAGGIPVGTGGKAAILISGGLDSPVAAWMMAKRGVELTAIHFASPPYTSERAHEKVVALLRANPHISVDVHNPEITVRVEIREKAAYIHGETKPGAGGIPVGTGGKAAILISGGLDSPVAAWMMAKRGVELTAIHFASPPYTSERAHEKVVALLKKVGEYAGRMDMITVPFTEIQEQIRDNCPEELATVIMRRFMMRAAERIARERECSALITGESLGQVASQTIQAIACTDAAANMPVFRPLIGSDKSEIVTLAHRIDTYDISIEPYEDCCTVFTPKHPRTRPTLNVVEAAEQKLDVEQLLKNCLEKTEIRHL